MDISIPRTSKKMKMWIENKPEDIFIWYDKENVYNLPIHYGDSSTMGKINYKLHVFSVKFYLKDSL